MYELEVKLSLNKKPTHHELETIEIALENIFDYYDIVESSEIDHSSCSHSNQFRSRNNDNSTLD